MIVTRETMFGPGNTPSILHLRVHSHTGGAELEGIPWEVSALPGSDGDFTLIIPLAEPSCTAGVLRQMSGLHLDLVTMHIHPARGGATAHHDRVIGQEATGMNRTSQVKVNGKLAHSAHLNGGTAIRSARKQGE